MIGRWIQSLGTLRFVKMFVTHFFEYGVSGVKHLLRMAQKIYPASPVFAAAFCCAIGVTVTSGATAATKSYNVPGGDAAATLTQFARHSGCQIVYLVENVRDEKTQPVRGEYAALDALRVMLSGTALFAVQDESTGALVVSRKRPSPAQREREESERSRGPPVANPPAPPPDTPKTNQPKHNESHPVKPRNLLTFLTGWLYATTVAVGAQSTGTIEGRVENAAAGTYLGNARLTIAGGLETFTDAFGNYRFPAVPVGEAKVGVFYTGFPAQEKLVRVVAGQVVTKNFSLSALGMSDSDATVKLDAFVVAAGREMSAAAMAVNEQRFSRDIRSVVATDSFGDVPEGNVGEFVKFLPGVTVSAVGGSLNQISLGGVPYAATPVTIDGNPVANAGAETRAIQLDQISINNMSRVEIVRSQTPDSPATGIGGSVNLVPKSAFERRRAIYSVKAFSNFLDHTLKEGPYSIMPSFELGAIVPVSPRFGFAVNATNSEAEYAQRQVAPIWAPAAQAVTTSFPATSPSLPYLTQWDYRDYPKGMRRISTGFTADWRISDNDVVSAGLQWGYFNEALNSYPRNLVRFQTGVVVASGKDFTQGAAGSGSIEQNYSGRDVTGTTWQPNLRWRHQGPVWKLEAGGSYSHSSYQDRNVDKGYWGPVSAYIRNVTVRFEGHSFLRPGSLIVTDAVGRPVDWSKLDSFRLETVGTAPVDRLDIVKAFKAHAQRELNFRVPVRVKLGFDYQAQIRDLPRSGTTTYNYVGADGMLKTSDDEVGRWIDPTFSSRQGQLGLPVPQGLNLKAIYDDYRKNPAHFQLTEANAVAGFRAQVNGSKKMTEAIQAPYLRFDLNSLMDRRLTVTGGVRFEQTEFEGVGPLINPGAIYQRDVAGNVVRNAAGQPQVIAPLASLAGTKLAYSERGLRTLRSYGDLYPSLNASYNVRPDLVTRISYAKSIARPNLNFILPSLTLPDPTSTSRILTVSNPNLNPWEADSYGLALEYYFSEKAAGLISARAYLRDIKNFWGATSTPITADIVESYGLDPKTYNADSGYVVSTRRNIGEARVRGLELDYRQNLSFLPGWAEGFGVFANVTFQDLAGSAEGDFSGFVKKTANWGLSFNRARVTARLSVNERGLERQGAITGVGVEPGTYTYVAARKQLDVSTEYRVTRAIAIFASARNLLNAPWDTLKYGPSSPNYSKLNIRTDFRPVFSAGVRGTF